MVEHLNAEQGRRLIAKTHGHQLESQVLQQAREYLRIMGWLVIRQQQNMGSHKGLSDLVCIRGGRVVFLECKTLKGKQSEHQVKFQADVESHGGEYRVVRCLEDAVAIDREGR